MTVLETLLHPIDRMQFREQYYGRQPLLIQGQPEKFAGLFTWEALNQLLNASPWPNPNVEISPLSAEVNSPSSVIEQCRAGASLIYNQIHLVDPKIGELARALESETGEPTNGVLFLSQPKKVAYPLHYDRHDVFVLHLLGHKRWSVYDRTTEKPIHERFDGDDAEPPSQPSMEIEMAPGDVLYLPRGHWHRALAQRGMCVHLTVGLKARTGLDFLRWLIDNSRNDVRFRQELPLSFADEPPELQMARLREHALSLGELLMARLRDPNTIPSFEEESVVADSDVHPFKFPAQLLDAPAAELGVRHFSRPARQRFILGNGPTKDKIALSVWGNVFYFRKAAKPLIEFIVSRTAFAYEDALAHAGGLSEQAVWDVLNPLLREGILDPV